MSILSASAKVAIGLQLCLSCHAFQSIPNQGPLKTTKELLIARGIALDHDSLISALTASNQTTRSLAAQELADQHAVDAAPYIEEAFRSSSDSVAHFNMAQALLQLNATTGKKLIIDICENGLENGAIRLESVKLLHGLALHDCDKYVFELARLSEDPQVKTLALILLPNSLSGKDKFRDALEIESNLLNDENAGVRIASASALATSGNREALAIIKRRLRTGLIVSVSSSPLACPS